MPDVPERSIKMKTGNWIGFSQVEVSDVFNEHILCNSINSLVHPMESPRALQYYCASWY